MLTTYPEVSIGRSKGVSPLLRSASTGVFGVASPARPSLPRLKPLPLGKSFFRYLPEDAALPPRTSRLLGVGRAKLGPGEGSPRCGHPKLYSFDWRAGRILPEHQIILLTNAAGEFESEETGRVRLVGDVLLFLFPGVWHRYRPLAGGGWDERWVSLQGGALRKRLALAEITPANPVFGLAGADRLVNAFDGLSEAILKRASARGVGVGPLVNQVVNESIRQAADVPVSTEDLIVMNASGMNEQPIEDDIVKQALEIIWNHQHSPPLGVSDVAKQLPVTRRTLDRKFSESLGRTVLDEINACRLSRAKRLLAETDSPVKAVAYLAGFPSRERLRLAFLQNEGMPPSEYREAAKRNLVEREID
ncbi:Arabinose operon regulatory protein [Botrimarina colliarenosi]|uniref:Arabinose operon regulatory protein n=1 Tax=Botrimarina colliarenosi TaxID=2528001 RepID=A0A5C6AE48_9BACT|nr:AraC family transcriptional regulator [Botrimarina colliarenosi]TWT97696.1 Arabinose operon regulatory protein [Botrimarina colliarenosi]